MELTKACGVREKADSGVYGKINGLEIMGCAVITCYYAAVYFVQDTSWWVMVIIMALIAIMFVYVFGFPKFHASQVMDTYFALIYAPVMLSFVFLTRQLEHGIYLVWMIFISSWISDTFAYLTGVLFGKHKLAPVLSPKKSIEGSLGELLAQHCLVQRLVYTWNTRSGRKILPCFLPLSEVLGQSYHRLAIWRLLPLRETMRLRIMEN